MTKLTKPWPSYQLAPGEVGEELLLNPPSAQEKIEADWDNLRNPKEPEEAAAEDALPCVPNDVLKSFIRGVLNGNYFVSDQVREQDMLSMVFLPLALGAYSGWSKAKAESIGIFYAAMSTALPRSINGYPCFPEVRVLNKEDWMRARLVIVREQERMKNLNLDL